jgi:hypothetical protein
MPLRTGIRLQENRTAGIELTTKKGAKFRALFCFNRSVSYYQRQRKPVLTECQLHFLPAPFPESASLMLSLQPTAT